MLKRGFVGIICISLIAITATAQNRADKAPAQNIAADLQTVEASCGQCNFNLPGKGCNLAIRIEGKAYFVDGTNIDDHGDSHAADGFCEVVRKASVKGTIVENRFNAEYFQLISEGKK